MFNLLKRIYPALRNYPKGDKTVLKIDKNKLIKDGDDVDILQKRMAFV